MIDHTNSSYKSFHTTQPLVLFGATGMLGGELAFASAICRFSPKVVLYGSDQYRLEGVRYELEDSGFDDIEFITTTDLEEAASYGGYIFYGRSVRSNVMTREEMLLQNAPDVKRSALAIRKYADRVERLICVTNPSDIMGLSLLLYSGLAPEKVISLSSLDTTRFSRVLRDKLGVRSDQITNAYTLGSHDLAMAVMLDYVQVDGRYLKEWIAAGELTEEDIKDIEHQIVKSGSYIVKMRGHSAYQSPAWHALKILEADDQKPFTLPTARYHHSERFPHCFFSFPCVIDSKGCKQYSFLSSELDMMALDRSYKSIVSLRDQLIDNELLPKIDDWPEELQKYTIS